MALKEAKKYSLFFLDLILAYDTCEVNFRVHAVKQIHSCFFNEKIAVDDMG